MSVPKSILGSVLTVAALSMIPMSASAFCGFYVGGAGAESRNGSENKTKPHAFGNHFGSASLSTNIAATPATTISTPPITTANRFPSNRSASKPPIKGVM